MKKILLVSLFSLGLLSLAGTSLATDNNSSVEVPITAEMISTLNLQEPHISFVPYDVQQIYVDNMQRAFQGTPPKRAYFLETIPGRGTFTGYLDLYKIQSTGDGIYIGSYRGYLTK